jgi:hypothetical protein
MWNRRYVYATLKNWSKGFKAEPTATGPLYLVKKKNEFETDLQTITSTLTRIPLGSKRGCPGPRQISGSATPTPDLPLSVTPLSSDALEGRRFCIARAAMVFLFREASASLRFLNYLNC